MTDLRKEAGPHGEVRPGSAEYSTAAGKPVPNGHYFTPTAHFTQRELLLMHRYCLNFRALVREGGKPTPEQQRRFMLYQEVCYAEGAAYDGVD